MKKYVLDVTAVRGENNAGSKAGRDAAVIAVENGYEFVKLFEAKAAHTTVSNILNGYLNTRKLCRKLKQDDIVFLQYPINRQLMSKIYEMLRCKKVHIVTLIHDIDFLRNVPLGKQGIAGMKNLELSLLSKSEYLICHNPAMIEALKREGLQSKFISLDLFDYLYDGPSAKRTEDDALVVAGNLIEKKAGYLYKLKNQRYKLSLYGSNLSDSFQNQNAEYHGSFTPDELIPNLAGTYGLVWDGTETDTCSGDYGQYLKLNNPHKVSLYLASGLPVIVWKQSALYPFVAENGVGFGVESLLDIDEEMKRQDYGAMIENVRALQQKVRSGYFLKTALEKVDKNL